MSQRCALEWDRGEMERRFLTGGHSGAAPPHSAKDSLGDLRNECFKTLTATPRSMDLILRQLQHEVSEYSFAWRQCN